jgi:Flp pilus assembly protein TadG
MALNFSIRTRTSKVLLRFLRKQDGATAVEFSLVAPPFLALLFALLETGIVFFAGQSLVTATNTAARLILTGQAQNQNLTQATFTNGICAQLTGLFSCSGVYVNVQTAANFASLNETPPVSNGVLNTSNFGFNPGSPGDVVVVQVYYQWPIFVTLLNSGLANMNNNTRLLVATAAFQNEPYSQ